LGLQLLTAYASKDTEDCVRKQFWVQKWDLIITNSKAT